MNHTMTTREYPRSLSSSVAPVRRPLRRRWTGANVATLASPLLLLALAGRTDACGVKVVNRLSYNLDMDAYNGWDPFCAVPFQSITVLAYGCACDPV
jgi:hypothetical protein